MDPAPAHRVAGRSSGGRPRARRPADRPGRARASAVQSDAQEAGCRRVTTRALRPARCPCRAPGPRRSAPLTRPIAAPPGGESPPESNPGGPGRLTAGRATARVRRAGACTIARRRRLRAAPSPLEAVVRTSQHPAAPVRSRGRSRPGGCAGRRRRRCWPPAPVGAATPRRARRCRRCPVAALRTAAPPADRPSPARWRASATAPAALADARRPSERARRRARPQGVREPRIATAPRYRAPSGWDYPEPSGPAQPLSGSL